MTYKEIIKALECCSQGEALCKHCGYYNKTAYCIERLTEDVLDLINRQQAEIDRLQIENQSLRGAANSYKIHYNEARVEAVKEFAEKLKINITTNNTLQTKRYHTVSIVDRLSIGKIVNLIDTERKLLVIQNDR